MVQQAIEIPFENKFLQGFLSIPENSRGLILFSHGSGSGRLSPRNQFVAEFLNKSFFATLLIDLLTEEAASTCDSNTCASSNKSS